MRAHEKLIKLAYYNPEYRQDLLPIILGQIKLAKVNDLGTKIFELIYGNLGIFIKKINYFSDTFPDSPTQPPHIQNDKNKLTLSAEFILPLDFSKGGDEVQNFCHAVASNIRKNEVFNKNNASLKNISGQQVTLVLASLANDANLDKKKFDSITEDSVYEFSLFQTTKPTMQYNLKLIAEAPLSNPEIEENKNFDFGVTLYITDFKLKISSSDISIQSLQERKGGKVPVKFIRPGLKKLLVWTDREIRGDYTGLESVTKILQNWSTSPYVLKEVSKQVSETFKEQETQGVAKSEKLSDLKEIFSQIDQHEQDVKDIQDATTAKSDIAKNIAKLNNLLIQFNREDKTIQDTITNTDLEISDIKDKNKQFNAEIVKLTNEIKTLNNAIAKEKKKSGGDPAPLETRKLGFQAQIANYNKNINSNNTLLNSKIADKGNLQQQLSELQSRRQALSGLFDAVKSLQKEFVSLGKEITKLMDKIDSLKTDIKDPSISGAAKTTLISELSDLNEQLSGKVLLLETKFYRALDNLSKDIKKAGAIPSVGSSVQDLSKFVSNFDIKAIEEAASSVSTFNASGAPGGSGGSSSPTSAFIDIDGMKPDSTIIKSLYNQIFKHIGWDERKINEPNRGLIHRGSSPAAAAFLSNPSTFLDILRSFIFSKLQLRDNGYKQVFKTMFPMSPAGRTGIEPDVEMIYMALMKNDQSQIENAFNNYKIRLNKTP